MNTLKYIAILLLLLLQIGCGSQTIKSTPSALYDKNLDCSNDQQFNWQQTSLEKYLDHCTPLGWEKFFNQPSVKNRIKTISNLISQQLSDPNFDDVNPKLTWVFRAMEKVKPAKIKSFLVGQDPAPQRGEATGLAFSLKPGTNSNVTPSVQRVMLEAQNEGSCVDLNNATLLPWADQGVFLWNVSPTIPCKRGASSCDIGKHLNWWKPFSEILVQFTNQLEQPMSYIMWGGAAGEYASLATNKKHLVIKGRHPSPRNKQGRFFCKSYFTSTNDWLREFNKDNDVNWNLVSRCKTSKACVYSWDSSTRSSYCTRPCQ